LTADPQGWLGLRLSAAPGHRLSLPAIAAALESDTQLRPELRALVHKATAAPPAGGGGGAGGGAAGRAGGGVGGGGATAAAVRRLCHAFVCDAAGYVQFRTVAAGSSGGRDGSGGGGRGVKRKGAVCNYCGARGHSEDACRDKRQADLLEMA
jgi:hypothetical protein